MGWKKVMNGWIKPEAVLNLYFGLIILTDIFISVVNASDQGAKQIVSTLISNRNRRDTLSYPVELIPLVGENTQANNRFGDSRNDAPNYYYEVSPNTTLEEFKELFGPDYDNLYGDYEKPMYLGENTAESSRYPSNTLSNIKTTQSSETTPFVTMTTNGATINDITSISSDESFTATTEDLTTLQRIIDTTPSSPIVGVATTTYESSTIKIITNNLLNVSSTTRKRINTRITSFPVSLNSTLKIQVFLHRNTTENKAQVEDLGLTKLQIILIAVLVPISLLIIALILILLIFVVRKSQQRNAVGIEMQAENGVAEANVPTQDERPNTGDSDFSVTKTNGINGNGRQAWSSDGESPS